MPDPVSVRLSTLPSHTLVGCPEPAEDGEEEGEAQPEVGWEPLGGWPILVVDEPL
jgi:hypothetical protein